MAINAIGADADEAESELTMIDQLMRIISNRTLITKLLLILLIIFLAIADVIILSLKLAY
jgi:hypothetical protein